MTLSAPSRRWAISLADISLLLAAMLLLDQRPAALAAPAAVDVPGAAAHPATPSIFRPAQLFVAGEALLRADARDALRPAVQHLARGGSVTVGVGIAGAPSARLDAWELAAARTAALARALPHRDRIRLLAPDPAARGVAITLH